MSTPQPLDEGAGHLTGQPGAGALPAVLGRRDLTLFMVLIVVFVSNTNGVQFGGPVAFLYWALGQSLSVASSLLRL